MSGYLKIVKVKDGDKDKNNKLMSFDIDDEILLEKYKIFWTKSNNSKEYIICHYWVFNHGFEFQDSICNGCHDLTMLCLDISDIAIITVKGFITIVLFMTLVN